MENTLAHIIFQIVTDGGFVSDRRHVDIVEALYAAKDANEISVYELTVCLTEITAYQNGWDIFGILARNGLDNSNEAIIALYNDWDNRPELIVE